MKRIRWIILWTWIIVSSCCPRNAFAFANTPPPTDLTLATVRFQTISLEQGLSQSVILDIVQDRRGFLWIATEDGLNHYNGYKFTIYRHDPENATSLANNYVRALYVDRQGTLWVGNDSGLDRFDPETDGFTHFAHDPDDPENLGRKEVYAVAEDADGSLWVGAGNGGLSRLDPVMGTFTTYRHAPDVPQSLSDNNVSALLTDSDGVLWIGTNAGLDRFDPSTETFTHYQPNPGGVNAVRAIYEDDQGQLWIGMEGGGLARLDQERQTFTRYTYQGDDPYSLSDDTVWAILEDRAGRLWIGTQNGLNRWDAARERFGRITHNAGDPRSLSADTIRSIYEDRSGVVWFGTYGAGLSKLTRAVDNFILFQHNPNDPNSLSENAIWTVTTTDDGSVWVGTMREGLDRMDRESGTVTHYQHDPEDPGSLSHNDVRILLTDHTGVVWIGTYGGGLERLDPQTGTFIHYRHDPDDPASLGEDQIRMLFEDRAGNLWIATQSQGLDYFDRAAETFTHYRHDPANLNSLSGNRVRAILEDRTGRIWLGTWNEGLNALDPETGAVTRYRNNPDDPTSLSNDIVLALHEDAQGVMWVGTYGGGLARFDPATETFRTYTQRDGLPNDGIYGILEDDQGHLWISTNLGLARFNPRTETFRTYDINDGLQSNEFNYGASHRSAWGEFFFAGIGGLNAFYPDQVEDNPYLPPVIITDFRKQNQSLYTNLPDGQQIALSYADNFISFDFAALDYNAPEEQHYAYKMEGQDSEWIDAGTRRHADYTNLKGGKYVFHVRAANSDGVWNTEGATVQLTVTPPFWETWGFRGVVVLLLVGVMFGGYRLRLHTIEARSRELEQQVAERTAEIERRRQVAESLQDILKSLNSARPLDEILKMIVAQACRLGHADAGVIYHYDEVAATSSTIAMVGMPAAFEDLGPFPLTGTNPQRAVAERQPHYVPDFDVYFADIAPPEEPTLYRWYTTVVENFKAKLTAPVYILDQPYGALELYYRTPRAFTSETVALAIMIGNQAALAIENARLREQAEEVAVAAERNRIARELHDSVSQALYGIALGTRTARTLVERQPVEVQVKTTLAHPLEYVLSLAEAGLAEMRALIFELRPDALEKEGLVAALTKQVEAIRARHKLDIITDFCSELPDLPLAAKEALYRVAQEALNNLVKHAQASHVDVRLRCEDGALTLEVQDDGVGFDTQAEYPGHLGLHTMHERVTRLGGTLTIESAPGEGTTVRAYLPL